MPKHQDLVYAEREYGIVLPGEDADFLDARFDVYRNNHSLAMDAAPQLVTTSNSGSGLSDQLLRSGNHQRTGYANESRGYPG